MALKQILKPLIKRKEVQFKQLFKLVNKKMARQTSVNNLQKATDDGIITKREAGRSTYYSLNTKFQEEKTITEWLDFIKTRLSYIPEI